MFLKDDSVCLNGLNGYMSEQWALNNTILYNSYIYSFMHLMNYASKDFYVEEVVNINNNTYYVLSDSSTKEYFLFDNTVSFEMSYSINPTTSIFNSSPVSSAFVTHHSTSQHYTQVTFDDLETTGFNKVIEPYPFAGKVEVTLETGEIVAGVIIDSSDPKWGDNNIYTILLDHSNTLGIEFNQYKIPKGYGYYASHKQLKYTGETDWKIERAFKDT